MIDMHKTGEWLRYLCKRKNIPVSEIQEKLYISSNQAIYAWFNGKTLPYLNNMLALSDIICIPINDLLVIDEQEHPFFKYIESNGKRLLIYFYRLCKNI